MTRPGRALVRNRPPNAKIHRSVDTFKGILDRIPNGPLDVRALIGYLGANTLSAVRMFHGRPERDSGKAARHTRPNRCPSGGGRPGDFQGVDHTPQGLFFPAFVGGSESLPWGVCLSPAGAGHAVPGGVPGAKRKRRHGRTPARAGQHGLSGSDASGRGPSHPALGGRRGSRRLAPGSGRDSERTEP